VAGGAASGPVVLVGGPTASGKSPLALALAEAHRGTLINADSMQVYRDLRVLTARPTPADEAAQPHALYGIVDAGEVSSAMRWRAQAVAALEDAWAAGRWPIVVGGTGLYFRSLLDGLAPVTDIPEAVRHGARARHAALGGPAFHAELATRDPAGAARLRPGDSQRLMRAWEVLEATGRPLADWQREAGQRLDADTLRLVLLPDRATLVARIDARFAAMVEGGALGEVEALLARGLPADRPALRAVGFRELAAHLGGTLDRATAVAAGQRATRQLAKRQATWVRNQMSDWLIFSQQNDSLVDEIISKISQMRLTGPR